MAEYPLTWEELARRFPTEESWEQLLVRLRWPGGFRCVRCGSARAWRMRRGLYRCGHCDAQTSVTAGTIFQATRKPLRLWMEAIWRATDPRTSISALEMQQILSLGSYRTAWLWMHRLRRAMAPPGSGMLDGLVEADEVLVGGSARARARGEGTLVFLAVQDLAGRPGQADTMKQLRSQLEAWLSERDKL